MKKLDLRDHRAQRVYLTNDDYGLATDDEYVPKGDISEASWSAITLLPDTVALMTTDGFIHAIETMQNIVNAWMDIHDAMPKNSPMRAQCLAAYECFEGGIFNAVHGWYRLAGIAVRNAVEDIIIGLYYQHHPELNAEFEAVTSGKMHSPRRSVVDKELLKYAGQPLVDAVNDLYQKELSIYVHRLSDGGMWESNGPVFAVDQMNTWIGQYERAFRLLSELIESVLPGCGAIAISESIQFQKR